MAFYVPFKTTEIILKFDLIEENQFPELPYIIVMISILFIILGCISLISPFLKRIKRRKEEPRKISKKDILDLDTDGLNDLVDSILEDKE